MAKKLTPAKAKEILHDGTVHGKPITQKQRRFFGAMSNKAQAGSKIRVSNPDDPRLKSYQDSAMLHQSYLDLVDKLAKEGYVPLQQNRYPKNNSYRDLVEASLKNPKQYNTKTVTPNVSSVSDLVAQIQNNKLPDQLVSNTIEPTKVTRYHKGFQAPYPSNLLKWKDGQWQSMAPEKSTSTLGSLKNALKTLAGQTDLTEDIRVVADYSNVQPKEVVTYDPNLKNKKINTNKSFDLKKAPPELLKAVNEFKNLKGDNPQKVNEIITVFDKYKVPKIKRPDGAVEYDVHNIDIGSKKPTPAPKLVMELTKKPANILDKVSYDLESPSVNATIPLTAKSLQQPTTPYSFTFRDEANPAKQSTQYFPDLESWKQFTEQNPYISRDVSGDNKSAQAAGYRNFQAGGAAPIYTSDPKDPRLKAYQDSLRLSQSNISIPFGEKLFDNLDQMKKQFKGTLDWAGLVKNGEFVDDVSKYQTGIQPVDYADWNHNRKLFNTEPYTKLLYKKPVQPIVFDAHPMKGKQLSVSKSKLKENSPNIDAGTPTGKSIKQPVTNYSVTLRDESNPSKQRTQYLPDLETWKNFTDQTGYMSREATGDGKSAQAVVYNQFAGGGTIADNGVGIVYPQAYPTTSAGPNYVGEGYSTEGRNYSPAWGGSFQRGGVVRKNNGNLTPVTVTGKVKTKLPQAARDNTAAPFQLPNGRFANTSNLGLSKGDLRKMRAPHAGDFKSPITLNQVDVALDLLGFIPGHVGIGANVLGAGLDAYQAYDAFTNKRPVDGVVNAVSTLLPIVPRNTYKTLGEILETGYDAYQALDEREKNSILEKKAGGRLIKRADGSYSRHGLWDSIRENKGSGKKPTKEMLKQEKKIKAKEMEMGGYLPTAQQGRQMFSPNDLRLNPEFVAPLPGAFKIPATEVERYAAQKAKEAPATVKPTPKGRSAAAQAWVENAYPMTALGYRMKGQSVPQNFEKGEINPYDQALATVNPFRWAHDFSNTGEDLAQGNYTQAAFDAASVLPFLSEAKAVAPGLNSLRQDIGSLRPLQIANEKAHELNFKLQRGLRNNFPGYVEKKMAAIDKGNKWSQEWYSNPIIQDRYEQWIEKQIPSSELSAVPANNNKSFINIDKGFYQNLFTHTAKSNYKKLLNEGAFTKGTTNRSSNFGDRSTIGRFSHGTNDALIDVLHPALNRGFNTANTTVHENIHAITMGDEGLTQNAKTALRKPFAKGSDKYDKYLRKPTEVHARIGELRRQFGLTPEQEVDVPLMNRIMDLGLQGKTSVDKRWFEMVEDKPALRWLFNNAPMAIPAAATAAVASQQGEVEKKQMGGALPGAGGMMYARTGQDWKPKSIGEAGLEVPVSSQGLYDYPQQTVDVPTSKGYITMKGIDYPVLGTDENGMQQVMQPGGEYQYSGQMVREVPLETSVEGDPGKQVNQALAATSPYDNNTTYRDLVKNAAKAVGVDPRMLWSSSFVEGMGLLVTHPDKVSSAYNNALDHDAKLQDYQIDGFYNYGLDNFGDVFPTLVKKGYLPKDFDYHTFKAMNEQKKAVNTAAFKNNYDAIRAKAAYLRHEGDRVKQHANKLNLKLSPDEQSFFTMAAYNGGLGSAQAMLDALKKSGLSVSDYIKKGKTPKGQVYKNIKPRYDMMAQLNDIFEAGGTITTEQDRGQLKKLDQLINFSNYNYYE